MGRFAPLLDDGPSQARLSVPQNEQSEFRRNSPFIPQDESVGTRDRGGSNLDVDLGRALNSTPRLATNAANKYHPVEDEEAEELGYRPAFVNDEYVDDAKRNARKAIMSGMAMGTKAENLRSKFANIRKRHWGGLLNYKNWGWVRERRERKLRAQIQSEFPGTESVVPSQAPATSVAEPKVRENPHMEEAEASLPFSAGGAYQGKADVTALGNGKIRAKGATAANADIARYEIAMKRSMEAEGQGRKEAAVKTRQDQGELSMAKLPKELTPFRTALYNGYWGAEAANPTPTRKAGHDRRVRFADEGEPVPADKRDPNRPFAKKQEGSLAAKAARKAIIAEQMNALRTKNGPIWSEVESAGARWHQDSPMIQAAMRAQAKGQASARQLDSAVEVEEKAAPIHAEVEQIPEPAPASETPTHTPEFEADVTDSTPVPSDPRRQKAARYFRSGFNPDRHLLPGEKAARRHDLGPGATDGRHPAHEDPRVKPTPEYMKRIEHQLAQQRPAPMEMIQPQAPRAQQALPQASPMLAAPQPTRIDASEDTTGSADTLRVLMDRIARYRS